MTAQSQTKSPDRTAGKVRGFGLDTVAGCPPRSTLRSCPAHSFSLLTTATQSTSERRALRAFPPLAPVACSRLRRRRSSAIRSRSRNIGFKSSASTSGGNIPSRRRLPFLGRTLFARVRVRLCSTVAADLGVHGVRQRQLALANAHRSAPDFGAGAAPSNILYVAYWVHAANFCNTIPPTADLASSLGLGPLCAKGRRTDSRGLDDRI